MSTRTHLHRPLRALGVSLAAATLAAAGSAAPAAAQECPAAPAAGQSSQTFGYTGGVQQFALPAYVNQVNVTVRGGHGGGIAGQTGAGGRPGVVTGLLSVPAGSCLNITVGQYAGGYGYGGGGDRGGYPGDGKNGGRGGGGSAIALYGGSAPVVVAGGGGGAGGNSGSGGNGDSGGAGGDGAGGNGPGTPAGGNGGAPPRHVESENAGGQRRPSNGPNGISGETGSPYGLDCGASSGGGGGGGGGQVGGGAGYGTWAYYPPPPDDEGPRVDQCDNVFVQFGGGGGAGGDSYAAPASVSNAGFAVDHGACPGDGSGGPTCMTRPILRG